MAGGSWGRCDFRELRELDARLSALSEVDLEDTCTGLAEDMAKVLYNKVKKRTPVGHRPVFDEPHTAKVTGASGKTRSFLTKSGSIIQQYWTGYRGGTLRDAWRILPVGHRDDRYVVVVINPTAYASYVEFGHRQQRGRYVPALGKSLVESFTPGRFMLTKSEQELQTLAPVMIRDAVDRALKGVF